MRILWYNWRDIKNPEAGGAEVFTHEICKRLIAQKKIDSITLFTSTFEGALAEETIDGLRIVRRCHKNTMYRKAREFYQRNMKDFDIVIDEINTKPFDTPSFVRDKPLKQRDKRAPWVGRRVIHSMELGNPFSAALQESPWHPLNNSNRSLRAWGS